MSDQKIVPYTTATGIRIGQFYEPRQQTEMSADMEVLQLALLGELEYMRRMRLKSAAYVAGVVAMILILAIVTK